MSAGGSFDFVEGATADLTLVARGTSLDEVFRAAAEALAAATVERVDAIEADTDLDLLLLRFLNELIYLRDAEGLILRPSSVRVETDPAPRLAAELAGEEIDAARHGLGLDVKAATVHDLRVQPVEDGWEAHVTLDV